MLASSLKRLADTADIAKLDLAPGALTLAPIDGGLLSWYSGAYAGCGIRVETDLQELTQPVSIAPDEFQQLAVLFEDDTPIALRVDSSALTIVSRARRASLRFLNKPDVTPYEKLISEPFQASVKLSELVREAAFAGSMSATTMATPILTGIRIVMGEKMTGVQAANGSSLIFESAIAGVSHQKFQIVAPAQDLQLAIRLLRGERVEVAVTGKALLMRGEDSIVKLPTLAGLWPNIANTVKALQFGESLSLPSSSIRSVAAAARAYKASNDITIRPTESDQVILETADSEKGQFQEAIPGHVSHAYTLDVSDLDAAARVSDGTVQIQFCDTMALVTAGQRKLYVSLRLRR